ncbi:MAG TPA: GGDEF domain-containing protein [Tepidisphaeraceae bacterium]|jgi:diguanylate cyclase (GGDEF)-like protein|nr:GGDEF domain-containing protein [Tepidisphaeraceae bacterium]
MAQASTSIDPGENQTKPQRGWTWAVAVLLLLSQVGLLIGLADCLWRHDMERAAWLAQLMLSAGAGLAAVGFAARRQTRVYGPLRVMERLIPEIRAGRAAIEELSQIHGRLAPLAAQVQELLRELRGQKAAIGEMDNEVRQRIASRTQALERKIGSLRHQATRDVLTGLFNRRMLDEHLAQAIERCRVGGMYLAVLMIDVDNFKCLNDTMGHAAGDEFLRSIGQIIRSTVREADAAFRCGGDEFVIVLEGADAEAAHAMAERLTSLVDSLVKTLHVRKPPRLSIGVSKLQDMKNPSAEGLMHNADQDLYAIKARRKSLEGRAGEMSPVGAAGRAG